MKALLTRLSVLALCGCATAQPAPTPESEFLKVAQVAITDQSLTDFTAEARMELNNSTDTAMQIGAASWALSLDGTSVASGSVDLDQTAEAGQTITFRVPGTAEIVHSEDELKALVAHADQPLEVLMKGSLKVTQAGKTSELPYARVGTLRAPRLPIPKMNDAALGRADDDVSVSFYFGLANQNAFKVKVKNITYHAELDGKEVGAGVATTGDDLPASQTAEFPIQESVPELDRSKNQIPYHFTGTVDLGITQVPVDLSGTLTWTNKDKKAPAGKKKKKGG